MGMSGKALFSFELVFYEPVQSDVSVRVSYSPVVRRTTLISAHLLLGGGLNATLY